MTTLDPQLLEILACPSADHAPLRYEPAAGASGASGAAGASGAGGAGAGAAGADGADGADGWLVCTVCLTRYPVRDGIPVLLVDDATPGPRGVGVAADAP